MFTVQTADSLREESEEVSETHTHTHQGSLGSSSDQFQPPNQAAPTWSLQPRWKSGGHSSHKPSITALFLSARAPPRASRAKQQGPKGGATLGGVRQGGDGVLTEVPEHLEDPGNLLPERSRSRPDECSSCQVCRGKGPPPHPPEPGHRQGPGKETETGSLHNTDGSRRSLLKEPKQTHDGSQQRRRRRRGAF